MASSYPTEHVIFDSGIHLTRPGPWYLYLSDRRVTIVIPWVGFSIYNWALDWNTLVLKRGWDFVWGRGPYPYEENRELFLHKRERLEFRRVAY